MLLILIENEKFLDGETLTEIPLFQVLSLFLLLTLKKLRK